MHLTSPRWKDRWSLTATQYLAARVQYASLLYPHGLPTDGVDVIEPGFTGFLPLPDECASLTRYTVSAPGQRPGGDPQHTYLFYPKSNVRGELVVWMCGHSGTGLYLTRDEGPTIPMLLAAGYHVLSCDQPGFDWLTGPVGAYVVVGGTWSYSANSWHNVGGTPTWFYEHNHNFLGDGGPLAMLQYVHHVIVSTTTAVASLNPARTLLAGHSGGGVCGHVVAALDNRFTTFCSVCPGLPYNQYYSFGSATDWETYLITEPFINPPYTIDIWGSLRLAMSVPGRRTDVVSALNDEYWFFRDIAQWYEDVETMSDQAATLGNTFTHWLDPAPFPQHNMHPERVDRMISILNGDQ